jgi:hypothetical protein
MAETGAKVVDQGHPLKLVDLFCQVNRSELGKQLGEYIQVKKMKRRQSR